MAERQPHLSESSSTNDETEVFSSSSPGAPSAGESATRTLPEASAHLEGSRGARPAFPRVNRPASPAPAKTASRRYRPRLFRRISAAAGCALLSAVIAFLAIFTVKGQAIDTLSMEAAMRWADPLGSLGRTVTHIISVPAMVIIGVVVVVIAWLRRRPTLAGRALGMVIAANTTTQVAKLLIERPDYHMSAATVNSLPSGHTTVAIPCLGLGDDCSRMVPRPSGVDRVPVDVACGYFRHGVWLASSLGCAGRDGRVRFLGLDSVSSGRPASSRGSRAKGDGRYCACKCDCRCLGLGVLVVGIDPQ